ncbi:MAG TPA: serine hydrolase domain-containing protein [Dongiaceae bacterium]|nr:serine hydrolase domain-containing protein [Dongiaceae bacterium]
MRIKDSFGRSARGIACLAVVSMAGAALAMAQTAGPQALLQGHRERTASEGGPYKTGVEGGQPYTAGRENADKQGKEWIAKGDPGLALAVAIDGKLVYSEGFGYADLEERVPVWPTTKFRIGSISKPLTAVGLMRLVEAGKVDLDAPVQKYVPSFPDKGATITVRMVAGHLGGIRHYKDDEFTIQKHYANVRDGLRIFEDDPLVAPPGTKFNYSSYGFNLLSAVMESAAGESFLPYMQGQVFGPLGLVHTMADQNTQIVEQRSRFYEIPKDGPVENAPYVDNSYKWAGGGFLSTAEDLVRFGSALLQPGFLKAESLNTMFTSQKTASGEETGYGIGWGVAKSKSGKVIYEHSGGSVGGTSQLIVYPETHVVVALVTNLSDRRWTREEVEAVAEGFEAEKK